MLYKLQRRLNRWRYKITIDVLVLVIVVVGLRNLNRSIVIIDTFTFQLVVLTFDSFEMLGIFAYGFQGGSDATFCHFVYVNQARSIQRAILRPRRPRLIVPSLSTVLFK